MLTGSLGRYTREECRALIEKNGGTVTSGVSSRTDIVIAGDKAGSKLAKAEELGIEMMSEEGDGVPPAGFGRTLTSAVSPSLCFSSGRKGVREATAPFWELRRAL